MPTPKQTNSNSPLKKIRGFFTQKISTALFVLITCLTSLVGGVMVYAQTPSACYDTSISHWVCHKLNKSTNPNFFHIRNENIFGRLYRLENENSSKDYFIPAKSVDEWERFKNIAQLTPSTGDYLDVDICMQGMSPDSPLNDFENFLESMKNDLHNGVDSSALSLTEIMNRGAASDTDLLSLPNTISQLTLNELNAMLGNAQTNGNEFIKEYIQAPEKQLLRGYGFTDKILFNQDTQLALGNMASELSPTMQAHVDAILSLLEPGTTTTSIIAIMHDFMTEVDDVQVRFLGVEKEEKNPCVFSLNLL